MRLILVLIAGLCCLNLFNRQLNVVFAHDDDADVETDTTTTSETVEEKIKYVKPVPKGPHHFLDTFDIDTIGSKWIKSLAKKAGVDDLIAKYEGDWAIESAIQSALDGDKGLVLKSKAKHHAISAKLLKPFQFKGNKPLIVQYEVKFQNALECGGAYVKLLTESADLKLDQFLDKTPYTIMFGPDKCGSDAKYHFIIRYKNPKNGEFEEKHAKRSENIDTYFGDGKTHLYTLIVRPDNTYKMLIDQTEINSGSLLADLTPPINPKKEIVDVTDKKPEDWDDREKIPDPDAVKPEDWDENEPKMIKDESAVKPDGWLDDEELTMPDPNAVMPADWDVETDGEWEAPKIDNPACKNAPGCGKWEAPMIENPKYKGKWRAPQITNPNFKGIWEPRKIPNPNYFEDKDPFKSIVPFSAVGLELWSMTDNIYFDNFLVTDDETVANEFAKESWLVKHTQELKASGSTGSSVVDSVLESTKERPWLWAVFVLAGVAIIVFIFMCCCGKGGKQDEQKTDAATTKKTDAPTKDDDTAGAEQGEEEDGGEEGEGEEEERVEQEEKEINDDEEEEEEQVVEDKKNKSKTASNASLDKSSPKTSPKATKRKPRKD